MFNFTIKQAVAQVFPCEFFEISKNTFSYRAPPVAACDGRWEYFTKVSFLLTLSSEIESLAKYHDNRLYKNYAQCLLQNQRHIQDTHKNL